MSPQPRTLSLRKNEVQEIEDIHTGDHESANAAAKAVLSAAYKLFQRRDWWVITSKEFGLSYGVYGTESEAVSKAEAGHSLGLGGQLRITKIHSTLGQEAQVSTLDAAALTNNRDPLCECGHRKSNHAVPGQKVRKAGCFAPSKVCKCAKYREQKED